MKLSAQQINASPALWSGALRRVKACVPPAQPLAGAPAPVFGNMHWMNYARHAYMQIGPSCVLHGEMTAYELMLTSQLGANALDKNVFIDREAIWKRAREMFWNGDMTGGLYPEQGIHAALDMGVLPPGTKLVEVSADVQAMSETIAYAPLIVCLLWHDGMAHPNPYGCIDHRPPPQRDAGHCQCLVGQEVNGPARDLFYWLAQSYGPDFGWHSFVCMRRDEYLECSMDGPYRLALPDRWWEYDGYRKHLKKVI